MGYTAQELISQLDPLHRMFPEAVWLRVDYGPEWLVRDVAMHYDTEPEPIAGLPAVATRAMIKRRRRRTLPSERSLTPNECETMQAVSDANGNVAEAARTLGKHYSTVREQYTKALGKLSKSAKKQFIKTLGLPTDSRGQSTISEGIE